MRTFSQRTRQLALESSNGKCQCSKECALVANQMHHKVANTKVNNVLYPLFIHSIFNCCPINADCHSSKPLPRIRDNEAAAFESFLEELIDKRNQDENMG